jgi:hypothetical protein
MGIKNSKPLIVTAIVLVAIVALLSIKIKKMLHLFSLKTTRQW